MKTRSQLVQFVLAGLLFTGVAFAQSEKTVNVGGAPMYPSKNIVHNAAFDKLSAGTVEYLLKPENIEKLQTVLKFHVVPGKFSTEDLMCLVKKEKTTLKL